MNIQQAIYSDSGKILSTPINQGILNDKDIWKTFNPELYAAGLIEPFTDELVKTGLSYGLGSYGYDIRLDPKEFLVFQRIPGHVVNPKRFYSGSLRPVELHQEYIEGCECYETEYTGAEYFILPSHSYGLGVATEYIRMPEDVTGLCLGKSTYARAGVIVNMTPIEAGWKGHLTIEISNSSASDVMIFANEGIAQILFFRGFPCHNDYGDRKYQNQPLRVITSKAS